MTFIFLILSFLQFNSILPNRPAKGGCVVYFDKLLVLHFIFFLLKRWKRCVFNDSLFSLRKVKSIRIDEKCVKRVNMNPKKLKTWVPLRKWTSIWVSNRFKVLLKTLFFLIFRQKRQKKMKKLKRRKKSERGQKSTWTRILVRAAPESWSKSTTWVYCV